MGRFLEGLKGDLWQPSKGINSREFHPKMEGLGRIWSEEREEEILAIPLFNVWILLAKSPSPTSPINTLSTSFISLTPQIISHFSSL